MTRFTIFATLCVTTGTAFADTRTICEVGCDFDADNTVVPVAECEDVSQSAAETRLEGEAVTIRGTPDLDGRPTTILDGAGAHTVVVVVDRATDATVGWTEAIPASS